MGFLILLLSGCATKSNTLYILKNTELRLPHLAGEGRVEGKDCSYQVLYLALSRPRLDLAIENSLRSRRAEFNALADAEIIYSSKPFLFSMLGSKECLIVVGRPILLQKPEAPANVGHVF